MTESNKKQLLVLGNGFDLSCGLNSRYSDFFNEYYKKDLPNIKKLILRKERKHTGSGSVVANQLGLLDEKELNKFKKVGGKAFNNLDLFFIADHFLRGGSVNRWCDVEELIKEIVSIITEQASNEVPQYTKNKFDLYIKNQIDYLKITSDELFNEINEFEKNFKTYICKKIKNSGTYKKAEISLLTKLTKKFIKSNVLSFNYTYGPNIYGKNKLKDKIKSYRNIHGRATQKGNVIFGIDSLNVNPNSEMYRFTKTYRIMANNLNDNYIDILDDDVDTITFYGHSLAEADFSYFESIFDYYGIYDSKVTLEFYCVLYKDTITENNELRRENYKEICNLFYKYGESIGGMKGKNSIHKLLLENRLKIHYVKDEIAK